MAKVSVILCSYNQREYLADSVESVLAQTCDDWELLVVDNGSTDGSGDLLERWAGDRRVRLLRHSSNDAITRRLNEAVRESSGDFISLLYSDDYYLPHKLAHQLKIFGGVTSRCGVVYSPGWRLDVDTNERWLDPGPDVSGDVLRELLSLDVTVNPITPLVRRECFERHPFHEDVFVEGEGIFWRFATTHTFHFDASPTAVMRDHSRNIGRAVRKNYENLFRLIDKLSRDSAFPAAERSTLQSMKARSYRRASWQAVRVLEDPEWARALLKGAVATEWRSALEPKTALAALLALTPKPVLAAVNRVAARVRRPLGHRNNVSDYR